MSVDPTVDALMAYVEANPDNPEAPEDEAAETTSEEKPKEPILGKYDNREEATKGLHNLISKLGSETARASAAEERARTLEAELAAAKRTLPHAPIVTEEGTLDQKAFLEAVDARAEAIADKKLTPIMNALQNAMTIGEAEQAMLNEFGSSYYEQLPTYRTFLSENPKVNELVQRAEQNGQPLLARQYGWAEFQRSRDTAAEAEVQKRGAERVQKRDEARKDAAVLGGDRKAPPSSEKPKITKERMATIVDRARKGDFSEFDKTISVRGLPSEEELRKLTGWY